ncbi:MAG TPA: response regulator transcription factor [Taishania sp.]|nr:response regulator transcription factor [Taishania sp.]HNS41596.1 response regulator transcription factor [Taishania sp.]
MKVVIADGNHLMRIGLRNTLNTNASIKIVGEVGSSKELLDFIKKTEVDIVLIDYTSEFFDIDVIPKIVSKNPSTHIVAITPEQSAQTLIDALRSGVQSYIKKNCDLDEILEAVVETAKGKKFFCRQILETIRHSAINVEDIDFDWCTCESTSLSEREVQIIKRIADGMTNAEIAEELCLSNHTVNTHRKNILSKLGVKNTAGIVMYAVKMNIVSPNKFLFASE